MHEAPYPLPRFVSGHLLALAVVIFLGISLLLDLIGLLLLFDRAFALLKGVTRAQMLTYVLTGILFLVWIHRAYRNLLAFGVMGLSYSPGWAVGGFFVPLLNLFYPYGVVAELWRHSGPESRPGTDVSRSPSSAVVGWWWALFLLSLFIGNIVGNVAQSGGVHLFGVSAILSATLASYLLRITAAVLAIFVIVNIDRRQEEKNKYLFPGTAPLYPQSIIGSHVVVDRKEGAFETIELKISDKATYIILFSLLLFFLVFALFQFSQK